MGLKMQSKIGLKAPMYCTAVGKALLAVKTDTEIERYWNSVQKIKFTDKTIETYDDLLKDIRKIRQCGGNESRTRDLNLGKVALYQLSYSRKRWNYMRFLLVFLPAKDNIRIGCFFQCSPSSRYSTSTAYLCRPHVCMPAKNMHNNCRFIYVCSPSCLPFLVLPLCNGFAL